MSISTFHRAGRRRWSMTLVEVVITVALVAVAAAGIASGLVYGIYAQQSVRERGAALRTAGTTLETTKRTLFSTLQSFELEDVVLDDNGTPDIDTDDLTGDVALQFFDMDGNEVGIAGSPIPMDRSMIRARVTVEWVPSGRGAQNTRSVMLETLLAP